MKSALVDISNLLLLPILAVRNTLDAEKSIRVKSLITFSWYTMKEVSNIMRIDSVKSQAEVEHCRNVITQMLLPGPDDVHMTEMDEHIAY